MNQIRSSHAGGSTHYNGGSQAAGGGSLDCAPLRQAGEAAGHHPPLWPCSNPTTGPGEAFVPKRALTGEQGQGTPRRYVTEGASASTGSMISSASQATG